MTEPFQQTSSIVHRLRTVMTIIAVFIIFLTLALYFSSLSTIKGLQDLNSANNLLNLNAQTIELFNTAENDLDKVPLHNNLKEQIFAFEENQKIRSRLIHESLKGSARYPDVINMLKIVEEINSQFINQREHIFASFLQSTKKDKKSMDELTTEILVAKQLIMDAKDVLRKIQIAVKKENDQKFAIIYKNRLKPLIVAVTLAVLFFVFVITFGLNLSRRIGHSIFRLLNAADKIAQGDLGHQVKIYEHDEIGRLADAFNKMTVSLKSSQDELTHAMDRTKRLQAITASFSEALTPDQVYAIIFKQAFEALGAIAATIALVTEDKNNLELKWLEGYEGYEGLKKDIYLKWKIIPLSTDIPSTQVVRYRQPIFIEASELKVFSGLNTKEDIHPLTNSYACLPLVIASEAFGALSFSFAKKSGFTKDEKDFMMALARQCAQAIHRSQLYDNAKIAVEVRDEFLSIASHELRTPLTPLKLQLQGLSRQIKSGKIDKMTPEQWQKIAETSDRQINRLSTLIDDLLDVSRITSGKLNLKKEHFSLKQMIDEVIRQYAQQLRDAHALTDLVVEQDSIGFWDKVRIEQVFINLLTNATKYAPNKPIHITISTDNRVAKIKVRDEGPGIKPEDRERIFNRFERVASRENVGGLGLGLYISKQIVEAHMGKIYVESSSETGSIFTVELPELSEEKA